MHSNTPKTEITGLILCGGAGRRMGGRDKGLIEFQGKALVDIAIDRLQPQVQSIMISANRHADEYQKRGVCVIQDDGFDPNQQRFEGPLAGILAGLHAMQTNWLMVVPCDCPRFPIDIVTSLYWGQDAADRRESYVTPSARAAYVKDHPVFALIPRAAAPFLETYLDSGQRKLGQWLESIGAIAVPLNDESAFQNMNTPHDLSNSH